MSRPQRWLRWFMAALLLPATLAFASARDDYAWQWPLELAGDDAGAYQVTLDASVYRHIHDPGLADLAVMDADGASVPASLFAAGTLVASPRVPERAPGVTAVRAEEVLVGSPDAPEWVELEGTSVRKDGRTMVEYGLDGRFPIQQLDVALPGNHAIEWRLESRDDPAADWRWRAGPWMAYRVDDSDGGDRSSPQTLAAPVRDRYWRLTTPARVQAEPVLRLGYRPEAMVFLPARPGPHFLVAGSIRPSADGAPVWQLVAALRDQRGADWQPAPAPLGAPEELAGDAALTPRRDWTNWVLWGVLVLGALVVAALAVRVLRTLPPPSR